MILYYTLFQNRIPYDSILERGELMKFNNNAILDLYQDEAKNKELIHDMNLKLIPTVMKYNIYKIRYTYKTKRGNRKENYRYAISKDTDDAIMQFIDYINQYNDKKQYRAVSNVKILETYYIGQFKQLY